MEGKVYYKIRYSLTTSLNGHGEFSQNQNVVIQVFKSETNDLNEVFTDLFGFHRNESIVGLEILSVEPSLPEISSEQYTTMHRYQ
ncbi:MAG TPA: hypothetical protein VNW06_04650 [Cytophagaceae bacterium]|jgi:hypothetical protein|nr:hypothetical protein [Cytophagaceae bacterium]